MPSIRALSQRRAAHLPALFICQNCLSKSRAILNPIINKNRTISKLNGFDRQFSSFTTSSKPLKSLQQYSDASQFLIKLASAFRIARVKRLPSLSSLASQTRNSSSAYSTSPLSSIGTKLQTEQWPSMERKKFFPEHDSKSVGYWLLASAASVFGIVVFGGLTRLTESGLSITEWRPVTGALPPMSDNDWESEFQLYRNSPEYSLLNPGMTLSDFKQIYWMEWGHRLWGRAVGLSFVLPLAYFTVRRRITLPTTVKLTGIASLIGFQGFLGWWMVKSGLKDDLFAPGSHPRVSQYRLVAHLGTAFAVYSSMLWTGLSILKQQRLLYSVDSKTALQQVKSLTSAAITPLQRATALLAGLVFITAMSGGLVAGLDAGLIYNEFPYMGTGLAPPKSELWSDFYSRKADQSDLWWRNMLENPSTVQLDHRIMATTTFTAVHAWFAYAWYSGRFKELLNSQAKRSVKSVVGLVWLQVALGISTLIYLVPVPLASAHQAGSLALLTGVIVAGSRISLPRSLAAVIRHRAKLLGHANGVPKSASSAHKISQSGRGHAP